MSKYNCRLLGSTILNVHSATLLDKPTLLYSAALHYVVS
jgi:hypothetical protein